MMIYDELVKYERGGGESVKQQRKYNKKKRYKLNQDDDIDAILKYSSAKLQAA